MIGTVLSGRYRILRKLGEGGMGEVYLAEHMALGRKEALKILQPELAGEAQFVSRFRREARATNRVQHPNIVSVYDFGQLPDGRFFLSMEYADGERLDASLRKHGTLPLPRALHVLVQLADAVDHAHAHGVVHRDLKPENLILVEHRRRPDVLKVLDFGIAKIIAPDHQESVGVTRKGEIFGTPSYMAPEQCTGEPADPRTDIYAIGCIAFELTVGAPPFAGRNMEIIHQQLTTQPDAPSKRRPDAKLPREFDAVVLRCLEKSPNKRYQTGRELAYDLERVPGFRTGRTGSNKRRHQSAHRIPTFEPEDTEERTTARLKLSSQELSTIERARTEAIALEEAGDRAAARCAAVRQLAEAIVDLGHKDYQLLIGLSNVNDLEDELARHDAEMSQLEARTSDIEQSARERESSLRFALGELLFARTQTEERGEPPPADLLHQIDQLEKRLARMAQDLAKAVGELTDRAIGLAAARAVAEEKMLEIYPSLERLIDEILPRYESNPAVAPLAVTYRKLG